MLMRVLARTRLSSEFNRRSRIVRRGGYRHRGKSPKKEPDAFSSSKVEGDQMLENWLKVILDWVKLKPVFLFGVATTCLVVVGLPDQWRQYLGYDSLINPYRGWISLLGLTCGAYALAVAGGPWLVKKWRMRRLTRNAVRTLMNLHPQEKTHLAKYIKGNACSLEFEVWDGVINGLLAKFVVYRGSQVSNGDYFPFNLQPWVLKAFRKNPDLQRHMLEHGG